MLDTTHITSDLKLLKLVIQLRELSKHVYLVGGCVRDLLRGVNPKDIDLVTDTNINELKTILQDSWLVKETGQVFQILFVSEDIKEEILTDEEMNNRGFCRILRKENKIKVEPVTFEIANFRVDGESSDGRHPDKVTTIEIDNNLPIEKNIYLDAVRRDFTINSLYLDPITFEILDPSGLGCGDIHNNILRFNLNPIHRITEDFLRLFRLFRFAISKKFILDENSLQACIDYFDVAYLNTTPERVRIELEKTIDSTLLNTKISLSSNNKLTRSNCGNFLLDLDNKIFTFSDTPKVILKNNPSSCFIAYEFLLNDFTPTSKTLSAIRENFNNSYKTCDSSILKNILLNKYNSINKTIDIKPF